MDKTEIINAIKALPESKTSYKIGIGITEHNRPDVFAKSLSEIKKYLPDGAELVVVDDASKTPLKQATFRFNTNVGIAAAKNKCLEFLYDKGCEHIFLFDSDTYPISPDWWKPYVESKEPHLNYIFVNFADRPTLNDTKEIYRDESIAAYDHPRGCMLYYHRSVLDKVGGMDTIFGKWGYEHPSHSDRIFMAGMTSFRYMDVVGSDKLIYSGDEHRQVVTTVAGSERKRQIAANLSLYEQRKFTDYYFPFAEKQNILLTCYFAGVEDSQRKAKWQPDIKQLEPLIKSLKSSKLIVLHDCFDEVPKYRNVEFVKVSTSVNPYIQRWISYREYLRDNKHRIGKVFCIDATDVEVLKEPEWDSIKSGIVTGDENEIVNCKWIVNNHKNKVLLDFFGKYGHRQLLNAGILGGSVENVSEFIRQMVDFYTYNSRDFGMTDMGLFNFIAYTNWEGRIKSGREVCTEFKKFETNNVSWFKHK